MVTECISLSMFKWALFCNARFRQVISLKIPFHFNALDLSVYIHYVSCYHFKRKFLSTEYSYLFRNTACFILRNKVLSTDHFGLIVWISPLTFKTEFDQHIMLLSEGIIVAIHRRCTYVNKRLIFSNPKHQWDDSNNQ